MIIWLNLLAFGGLEAVFLWPLVLGLYWERANALGALSSMITGALCYTLLASFKLQLAGLHPIIPALLISLSAFYLGNLCGEKRRLASPLSS
jgi:sodium/pantothenate symporter